MIYRNRRTGNVIDVPCEITGEDWELEKEPPNTTKKKAVKGNARTVRDDKCFVRNMETTEAGRRDKSKKVIRDRVRQLANGSRQSREEP